jgi:hypothetical protein
MKKLILGLAIVIGMVACEKDKPATDNTPVVTTGQVKFTGSFAGRSGYTASGTVKVLQNGTSFSLTFDPFSGSSGPDLKVYLSKQETPSDFISLGALKSTSGAQSYSIPAGTDLAVYKYALVHCQAANKVFAVAELKP